MVETNKQVYSLCICKSDNRKHHHRVIFYSLADEETAPSTLRLIYFKTCQNDFKRLSSQACIIFPKRSLAIHNVRVLGKHDFAIFIHIRLISKSVNSCVEMIPAYRHTNTTNLLGTFDGTVIFLNHLYPEKKLIV